MTIVIGNPLLLYRKIVDSLLPELWVLRVEEVSDRLRKQVIIKEFSLGQEGFERMGKVLVRKGNVWSVWRVGQDIPAELL